MYKKNFSLSDLRRYQSVKNWIQGRTRSFKMCRVWAKREPWYLGTTVGEPEHTACMGTYNVCCNQHSYFTTKTKITYSSGSWWPFVGGTHILCYLYSRRHGVLVMKSMHRSFVSYAFLQWHLRVTCGGGIQVTFEFPQSATSTLRYPISFGVNVYVIGLVRWLQRTL